MKGVVQNIKGGGSVDMQVDVKQIGCKGRTLFISVKIESSIWLL